MAPTKDVAPLAIDVVLPPAKTAKEEFQRWLNNMQSEFATAPWSTNKKIEVRNG